MILYVIAIAGVALWGSEWWLRGSEYHENYISKEATLPIKGIFTLLIIVSHFVGYVNLGGIPNELYLSLRRYLGQMVVALYLFYSGYGVLESISQKGDQYVKRMPCDRIFKVFVQLNLALIPFWLIRLHQGETYNLPFVFLTMIGYKSIGNSNWYILAILCLYGITWFSFTAFPKKELQKEALVGITIFTICLIYILWSIYDHQNRYCYDTLLAFPAGCWYSYYRTKIEKIIFVNKEKSYYYSLAMLALSFVLLHKEWNLLVIHEILTVVFSLLVVVVTMKIQIKSRLLSYCGVHLFSIYMLQRIPMILLQGQLSEKPYLYFAVCVVITFLISALFDFAFPPIWDIMQKWLLHFRHQMGEAND